MYRHSLKQMPFFLVFLWASFALAAEPAKKDDKQTVDSKAEKRAPATATDFRQELSLPFPSLGTLGGRIEQARRAHDPVSLAHAAQELNTAEKVSGKKASLNSQQILKESQELAKLRRQVAEMRTLLHVSEQLADEKQTAIHFKQMIADEQKRMKEESDKVLSGQEPDGTPRKVLVNNYTPQYVDLWVNGFLKMQLQPGQSKWCVIEHKWDPTVLKAYGNDDTTTWGPRTIWGNFKTYTWNLH